jgi:hypothetical protein
VPTQSLSPFPHPSSPDHTPRSIPSTPSPPHPIASLVQRNMEKG